MVEDPTAVTIAIILPNSAAKQANSPVCLLKVTVSPVYVNGRHTDANILFDEGGAQRSFVPNKSAQELDISPQQQ